MRKGDLIIRDEDPTCLADLDQALTKNPDLLIIALKTYHLDGIISDLRQLRDRLPPLLCFQNGVGSENKLINALGEDLIISGTITTAVDRILKGDVTISKQRGLGIAGNHYLVNDLLSIFSEANLNPFLYQSPDEMKWSKLLLNLLGNATSAILNMTPSQVYQNPRLFQLERDQILETISVMQLNNYQIINLPGVPVKTLVRMIKILPSTISRPFFVNLIGRGRGDKMPSLQLDLHSKREKSEVGYLNGAVVNAGQEHHFPTPANQLLEKTLTNLTLGLEPLERYHQNPDALLSQLSGLNQI
jgi:2-dehydropantoate 2-reductase